MKILIDIGHPAHVHLFKNFAWEMQKGGNEILFTCREKEFEIYLLNKYGLKFKSFGEKYTSLVGKIWGLFEFDLKELISAKRFNPDILLSHGSMYAAHAAFLLRKPHISLEDTGNWEQVRLYLPFTHCVLTSDVFPLDYGVKQIRFKSHNELAYLNAKYFHPVKFFKEKAGLKENDEYVILRFVAWNASHDIGQKGLSNQVKIQLVEKLSERYKVLISSELPLLTELVKHSLTFEPHQVHDALYNAEIFIGEGATMAMEAAVLGTPSVYFNTLQYSNIADMESYGLLHYLSSEDQIIEKVINILSDGNLKRNYQERRQKMLDDKINLTAFLVWFVENWPESFRIMKENPEYQERFK